MDDSTTVTLVGKLGVDAAFSSPDGKHTRPFILRLERPRCVDDSAESVADAHVAPYSDAEGKSVDLRPFLGKRIEVTGSPMEWHTGWHARRVVLMAKAVRVARP